METHFNSNVTGGSVVVAGTIKLYGNQASSREVFSLTFRNIFTRALKFLEDAQLFSSVNTAMPSASFRFSSSWMHGRASSMAGYQIFR